MLARSAWRRPRVVSLVGASLTIGCTLVACDSRRETQPANAPPPRESVAAPAASDARRQDPPPDASVAESDHAPAAAVDLYDPDIVPKFELTLDDAAIAVLSSANPADKETWVHAAFKMDGIAFADVGVRRKGSSTLRALPQKTSLKVKLNKWVKGQKLHGVAELTLNNMVSDSTFLGERLTYYVFRSLGLPASKANTARLTINGEDYGIYANIETPDATFLKRVFGAKAKTLYEVNYGSEWTPGQEGGFEIDVADPSAPVGTRPDVERLFAAVEAASDAALLAGLDAHLHTGQWLRHCAAEAVTGHSDGYAFSLYGSHNYFMAGDVDGKFSLVPWSADLTLADREAVIDAAAPLGYVLLARCKLGATCWDAYKAEMRSVLDAYATLDLVNVAKKWHAQIEPLVIADPKREQSLSRHDTRMELLYAWLVNRPDVIRAQLGL